MSDPLASMIANLAANTGHDLDWWVDQAISSGGSKHGEMMAHLKSHHGLTHGYANLVAMEARTRLAGGPASGEDLITAQYKGKEHLIPIYQQLLAAGKAMGPDVDVSPKKASVSLRRSKQFALIEPATKTRIDVGLNLRGVPGGDRLKEAGGMCTHKVAVTTVDEVDGELLGWIREAYEQA